MTHPLTGEPIEVWVGNYVLMRLWRRRGDGRCRRTTSATLRLPNKYGIPIRRWLRSKRQDLSARRPGREWYADKDGRCIASGKYDGSAYPDAVDAIAADLAAKGPGRQRCSGGCATGASAPALLGRPIPIIHCDDCGDGAGARRPAGGAAEDCVAGRLGQSARNARFPACRLPQVRQAGTA